MNSNGMDAAKLRHEARNSMVRRCGNACAALLAAMLMLVASAALPHGEAMAQKVVALAGKRTVQITVAIGKTEDVRTDTSFVELSVGDPEVADVNPLTDRSLSILGKKSGATRISAYAEGKKLIGVFDIEVTYDVSHLQSLLSRRFPHAKLTASSVNGRIMLSGTSPDAMTLDGAITIAKQFGGADIINSVEVTQAQQVMLEVRFVEANRQAGRDLGVQWNTFSNNGRFVGNLGDRKDAALLPSVTTTAAGILSGGQPFGFMVGKFIANGLNIDAAVNALEQKGMARTLAEPNLVALSGDTASFLAGGEFPIPVSAQQGQVTIQYKRFGVGLAFTPTVLSGGLVNIKIEPEVSQLDYNHQITLANGLPPVPSLIVRRASTTVELRDGQSFAIGGLLLSTGKSNAEQLPWLGDVPVLGALFASRSYQKDETDLAIIVTPRIVRPARPGDAIATPLDSSLPPNDTDLFLMGKHEITPAMAKLAVGGNRPLTGHMLDLPVAVARGGDNVVVSAKN